MSAASAGQRRAASPRALRAISKLFNPLAMAFAGTRIFPLYAVIQHVGRRSGKRFSTPLVVRPTAEGFIVPMPWGEHTDWYRNVRAAGGCGVRWRGRNYRMVEPRVLEADSAAAQAAFSSFQQAGLRRFGISTCLYLRHASAS